MRRRGFTIIEMLAVCALIAVFTTLSASLFRSAMRWTAEAKRQSGADTAVEAAIARLRADVWDSYAVQLGDERTAVLRHAGDRSTHWSVGAAEGGDADAGVTLTRTAVEGVEAVGRRSWPIAVASIRLLAQPGGLRVIVSPRIGGSARGVEVAMWSQVLLDQGAAP